MKSDDLSWTEQGVPFTWKGQGYNGEDLQAPPVKYRHFITLYTVPAMLMRYPDFSIEALVLGLSYGRHYSINHVVWAKNGNSVAHHSIHDNSWFKENEDLGDIIKAHRQALKDIYVLENTVKSQKQKLVELDNVIEDMQANLANLQQELTNIKSKQEGQLL